MWYLSVSPHLVLFSIHTVDVGEDEEGESGVSEEEHELDDQEDEEDEEEDEEEEDEDEEDLHDDEGHGTGRRRSGTPDSLTRSSSGGRSSSSHGPSLDARAQLARDLLALKGDEMGQVMSMVERECPAALETDKHDVPMHVELNLDVIPLPLFSRIAKYAADQVSDDGRPRGIQPHEIKYDDVSNKRRRKGKN